MRVLSAMLATLLIGSLASDLNSPGPADDPIAPTLDDLRAYQQVTIDMHDRWVALDAACDEDAIFALLYLITTGAVGDLVAAHHFADNPMLVEWDRDFAQRYFDAYDAYHAGEATPEPWRLAFEHADAPNSSVTTNMLLGMNAHVNYDLSLSAYTMELPQRGLKADYDRVNDAFWNVPIPLGNEFGKRYDGGAQRDPNDNLTMADEGTVELLISWREAAWGNAVALAATPDDLTRSLVHDSIEAEAASVAAGLIAADGGDGGAFQARCQASGHPPLPAEYGGDGYGDWWFSPGPPPRADVFAICHKPGSADEQTMKANEYSWKGHEHHGDHKGAC